MNPPTTGTVRLVPRLVLAALAAIALLLALQASSALAVIQTQTFTGSQPGTPNIGRTDLQYFLPSGAQAGTGYSGTFNLTLDGRPVVVYCVQNGIAINTGTVLADVTPATAVTADDRALAWILQTQTPTGPVTPAKQQEASTAQIALWVIGGQLRAVNPTNDPAANAAVASLVAAARAQTAIPAFLSLVGAAGGPGQPGTIAITAKPGAVVSLAVTAGPGTLSSTSVTVGPDGRASVTVSSPGLGTTVAATTVGDAIPIRIQPLDNSQRTAIAGGSELRGNVTVSETAATSVSQVSGSLRIRKRAPATAKAGANIRYRIRITNPSKVTIRNVVLRDRIPSGMSFVEANRGGEVENGRVVWELGTLRAGGIRTVTVVLQASLTIRGDRTNVATVSASGVKPVRAAVGTLFRAAPRTVRVQQRRP